MSEATKTAEGSGRVRGGAARDRLETAWARPRVRAAVVYGIAFVAGVIGAYYRIFSFFAPYDDEGTILLMLREFANGDVLYRDIYSVYGPFYYEVFGTLFALSGRVVSNDASRLIVVFVWTVGSLLFGLAAHRLTGRLALGLAAMAIAYGSFSSLMAEPMHPVGLCLLLLGALVVCVVFGARRRPVVAGAMAGATLAALFMTKVNIGAFAVAAVAFAAAMTVPALHRRRWIRWPVAAGFVLMPLVLMNRDIDQSWVREFVLVATASAVTILIASGAVRPRAAERSDGMLRWLASAAVAFVVASVAMVAIVVATGPSPADVWDGMITQPSRIRDLFVLPFTLKLQTSDWAIAAVAAAAVTMRLRSAGVGRGSVWPGVLRILAGLAIWFAATRSAPFGWNPGSNEHELPLMLAWIAVIAPAGVSESVYLRFARLLFPALAVTGVLAVYPVAGTQVPASAVLWGPVGALVIADGIRALAAWSASRPGYAQPWLRTVVTALCIAVAAKSCYTLIVRPGTDAAFAYADLPSTQLSGADRLHLAPDAVGTFNRLTQLLRDNCDSFVGYPSFNSLYLWTLIEPPRQLLPGAWMEQVSDDRQQRVVDELETRDRPCAIRSESRAQGWLVEKPPLDKPLVGYIYREFEPRETVGEWEFMLPKP